MIIYRNDYDLKVLNFISNNGGVEVNVKITSKFQEDFRITLNDCKQIIDVGSKWGFINLNPNTAILRGLIEVHKKDIHIRPIVNSINSPS